MPYVLVAAYVYDCLKFYGGMILDIDLKSYIAKV